MELSGSFNPSLGNLSYVGDVANGRGKTADEVQLIKDDNNNKQVSFMFTLEPKVLGGFGFGANILYDVIPSNPGVAGRTNEIDETIGGAHAFYIDEHIESIAEVQLINHHSGADGFHKGGYVQFAYKLFKNIKPYYRFDFLRTESGDAFFRGLAGVENTDSHSLGIRYDWMPFAAIKLEYRHADSTANNSNAGTAQISFAF